MVFDCYDPFVVALAATARFIPGSRLTMAVADFAAGAHVSGMARLAGAVLTLVFMVLGFVMGQGLFTLLGVGREVQVGTGSSSW